MKHFLLSLGLLASASITSAQTFTKELRRGQPIQCPVGPYQGRHFVAPPAAPKQQGTAAGAAQFVITYVGVPPAARTAVEYAVSIWESQIQSTVPIQLRINWTALGPNTLGGSYPTDLYRQVSGGNRIGVLYPVTLAEKLTGRELNSPSTPDIELEFNSGINWYFGTDGNTPATQLDLVSTVLHEIGHGLGFGGTFQEHPGFPPTALGTPLELFTNYLENQAGQRLADNTLFPNPSAALTAQITSGQVYFNSPLAHALNANERPRMYAPASYSSGSSLSHFDEATYPAGNPNSLMTPARGSGEAVHHPGPLMLAMLKEMGWYGTAIRHTPLRATESAQDFPVTATIVTDGTLTPNSAKLHYAVDNGPLMTLPLLPLATAGQCSATIPNPGAGKTIRYYLAAADNETGRTYTAPGAFLPNVGLQPQYSFYVGPDHTPPVISHIPVAGLFDTQLPYQLTAQVVDSLSVAAVELQYSVNGVARPAQPLVRQGTSSTYVTTLSAGAGPLVPGDVVTYRLVATDAATTPNQAVAPATGFYSTTIVGYKTPQASYANSFDTPTPFDFTGTGFSVSQPADFATPALHSPHPYVDKASVVYNLLVPIVVRSSQATVSFDHIALVGPDIPNVIMFNDDYALVEGSRNNGASWQTLGLYNSNEFSVWASAYRSRDANSNSTGVGTPALYRTSTINLLRYFSASDVVRLRFTLRSNDTVHGWGWAIDNLVIQPTTTPVSAAQRLAGASTYPNPSTGRFQLSLPTELTGAGSATLLVHNAVGQEVTRQQLTLPAGQAQLPVDLSAQPAGLYLVRLEAPGREPVVAKVWLQR